MFNNQMTTIDHGWHAVLAGILLLASGIAPAAEKVTYYHLDALGSPVAATDFLGEVVWRETYQPYGERIQDSPAAADNARWYTGHVQDPDTGLVYAGARYYDPTIGRFLAVDPVSFAEKNPHSFNRYAYGNNNPYKYIDPDGRVGVIALIPPAIDALGKAVVFVGSAALAAYGGSKLYNEATGDSDPAAPSSADADGSSDGGSNAGVDTTRPGPHAGDSVPARGPGRDFTPGERDAVNEIGRESGCHTCGSKSPGTKSGNFVPDHQPPNAMNPSGQPQQLYPQCLNCSRTQGGQVRGQQGRDRGG